MTISTNAALVEDLQDTVSKAMRRAWQLGQTYWQQADSEYTSQHRKADETQGKFDALVEETRAALSTAAQPPADGAMNTIAAMFHSGEEIEGPDGLAMMVDMSVWNAALDSFEGIIGDEMEPARPQAKPAQPERVPLTEAARDVLNERQRQISVEGWTPEHDDKERLPDELALAAASYVCADEQNAPPAIWPWDWSWWKPSDRRRNLVKSGALILAEIERLDRAAARAAKEGGA